MNLIRIETPTDKIEAARKKHLNSYLDFSRLVRNKVAPDLAECIMDAAEEMIDAHSHFIHTLYTIFSDVHSKTDQKENDVQSDAPAHVSEERGGSEVSREKAADSQSSEESHSSTEDE